MRDVVRWHKDGCKVSVTRVDAMRGVKWPCFHGFSRVRVGTATRCSQLLHSPSEAVRSVRSKAAIMSCDVWVSELMVVDAQGSTLGGSGNRTMLRMRQVEFLVFRTSEDGLAHFRRGVGCSVTVRHEGLFGLSGRPRSGCRLLAEGKRGQRVSGRLGQDPPDVQFLAKALSSSKVVRFSVVRAIPLAVCGGDADWSARSWTFAGAGSPTTALFEDVVNNARSHRAVHSGGGIVRHGGRRVESERDEVDAC